MKFVWLDLQRIDLCMGHRHSDWVAAPVEFYPDFQAGLCRRLRKQVDDVENPR